MNKTKIIVDSTFDMTEKTRKRVTVVPLTVRFETEEYTDGVTITKQEFYEKLIENDILPTTSQATPFDFMETLESETADGSDIVLITLSSKLSGTYRSAMIASDDYEGKVYLVDSTTTTIGGGILAQRAVELLDEGKTAKEIAEILEKEKEKIRVIALLDTLEYLKKGGRISKTAALVGGLISIKPVIEIRDGEIGILGKARGSKAGNNLLNEKIQEGSGIDFNKPILLGYTGLGDALLQKYMKDSENIWKDNVSELEYTQIGSVVGTHAGPGAIAAAYFEK